MASFRGQGRLAKPWHAKVRDHYDTHSLGYYATREEAEAVELDYRRVLAEENGTHRCRYETDAQGIVSCMICRRIKP